MMAVLSTIATIGGIITFAAFLADKYVQYGLTQYVDPIYIYGFGFLCLAVVLTHAITRLSQSIYSFVRIPLFLNEISMCTSSISVQLLDAGDQGSSPHLNSALKELCGSIATFFERLTRCPCAVCIKLLVNKETGEPHVRTLVRDLTSDTKRRVVDETLQSYPYMHNTAFNQIITRDNAYSFFISNNLAKLKKKKEYRNENVKWPDYYVATLVVPIAANDNPNLRDTTGFLCVDNEEGRFSLFPQHMMPRLLSTIAKQLYFILALNDRVLSQPGSKAAVLAAGRSEHGAKIG